MWEAEFAFCKELEAQRQARRRRMCILVGPYLMRPIAKNWRPMTGRWPIAMQRALPSQTWIRRLGSMQREGRGRAECTAFGTVWILLQCCPHMRVWSLLWHMRVHLLRRPAVVERT
ncbi:hypothetical protein Taro_032167 [Colocasia esculenta]|uniref:Uncharacterized protein n=1 Tax=Colocasia esculenta TaxID=4460 RepID=A0A843VRZ8_COLES|nr:hypothetical protein [Colocasia esculenta]